MAAFVLYILFILLTVKHQNDTRTHGDIQFLVLMVLITFKYVKLTHHIGTGIDQMMKQWAAVINPCGFFLSDVDIQRACSPGSVLVAYGSVALELRRTVPFHIVGDKALSPASGR